MNNAKNLSSVLVTLAIILCAPACLAAPITSQKANQMVQNIKAQTAQLVSVQLQPIFSEMPAHDLNALRRNVAEDMNNIRNDIKKIVTLLQTLSENQQEILSKGNLIHMQ